MSKGTVSPLCSPLHSNSGLALVAASSSDSVGMKTGWLILVPKAGYVVFGVSSVSIMDESFTSVFIFKFGLVARTGEGMGPCTPPKYHLRPTWIRSSLHSYTFLVLL